MSISDRERMQLIMESWDTNEETMGEQAALQLACEQHGVDYQWWCDHLHLLEEK